MTFRPAFLLVALPCCPLALCAAPDANVPEKAVDATPERIADWRPNVRWRGFNLLPMFIWEEKKTNPRFPEADFRLIARWGFNFVRLPLDYRFWTHGKDWNRIDDAALAPIDEAIAFGRKYGVHVQLCFHRAPGYCVNRQELEPGNLFKDPEVVEVCARHWAHFARRYRDIPNEALSFDLVNEPSGVTPEKYAQVARTLIAAIRREDPRRFICSDGIDGGNRAVFDLAGLPGVGQSMRGYRPFPISHYLAPWAGRPNATPYWPYGPSMPEGILAGEGKAHLRAPLELDDVPAGTLQLAVGKVSGKVTLSVEADGRTLKEIALEPRAGDPDWEEARIYPQWGNVCQAIYRQTVEVAVPEACRRLTIRTARGDWLELRQLSLTGTDGRQATLPIACSYRRPVNFHRRFVGWDARTPFAATEEAPRTYPDDGREYLYSKGLAEWDKLAARGVWTMVGEFGAYNTLPHDIFLAWMEDNLKLWKERDLSWALWNLHGTFGVLDSKRKDVAYEDFEGRKLDRKLLDLLQRY